MLSTAVNHATEAEGKEQRGNYICVLMGMDARSNVIGWSPRFQRQLQSGGHLSRGRKKKGISKGDKRNGEAEVFNRPTRRQQEVEKGVVRE